MHRASVAPVLFLLPALASAAAPAGWAPNLTTAATWNSNAPVAQGDAADRALAAALAMERALVSLNAELAVEAEVARFFPTAS
jgi:hypothetical protein